MTIAFCPAGNIGIPLAGDTIFFRPSKRVIDLYCCTTIDQEEFVTIFHLFLEAKEKRACLSILKKDIPMKKSIQQCPNWQIKEYYISSDQILERISPTEVIPADLEDISDRIENPKLHTKESLY